ncbi:hypothetical protein LOZ39_006657 [Ophidiomyces ophidiicola]|nr:hypothetical protein LOZ64_003640 [Ophidiomyces ophidiicola]KAI1998993.1 hypothetical protein LOZ50_006680 [Ophidiomyces ophidiicola]KAI2001491.1 hypothetical protein LOZ49_006619 [Ophidiomyces ophidiicola]KAI2030022.1 hypothetical protein LOZ47_006614 [Ophidiomyces ophidiicola]KAI2041116.1 hypothetical protein LOZ44_006591 [Ophidiomyces ophidiicola]
MDSMTSESLDRPASSLSESWASISNPDMNSEDDCHSEATDNLSLVGHSVADDVTSLDGRDLESDVDTDDTESRCSEAQSYLPSVYCEDENTSEDAEIMDASFSSHSDLIVFNEPKVWPSTGVVKVKHTIRELDQVEVSEVAPRGFSQKIYMSIQQSISRNPVNVQQPFRVLYLGDPKFKSRVLEILGDALVASPENSLYANPANSSKFHVVPASFGPDATPNYAELLPLHVQLGVEECIFTNFCALQDKIQIYLKSNEVIVSRKMGSVYQLESRTPDITIFVIGDNDSEVTQATRRNTYRLVTRHNLPFMVISESSYSNQLYKSALTIDPRSPHICLEWNGEKSDASCVVKRYPIDLDIFGHISPAQLNRNLACLAGARSKSRIKLDPISGEAKDNQATRSPRPHHIIMSTDKESKIAAIIFVIIIILCFTGLRTILMSVLNICTGFTGVSLLATNGNPAHNNSMERVPITMETPMLPQQIAVVASDPTKEKSLSISDDLLKLTQPDPNKPNYTENFQVYVVGDCHVIVKAPARFMTLKKTAKFLVFVTKEDTPINFQFTRLFDYVFTIRLAREDAHGLMNVTISSRPNLTIEQITEIDFGTPWLKIVIWKKAAQSLSNQVRKDLSAAQAGLSEAYNRVLLDVQVISDALMGDIRPDCPNPIQHVLDAAIKASGESKRRCNIYARRTVEKIITSLPHLQQRATVLAGQLQSKMLQHGAKAHKSALSIDLTRLLQVTQRVKRSGFLAGAQKQAVRLTQDARNQWKNFRDLCYQASR